MAVAVIATAGFLGTSAFTSATLDRDVSYTVTTDSDGPIGLSPDSDTNFVGTTNNGELEMSYDTNNADASGLNPSATFTVGDSSSPDSKNAFTITNQDNDERQISLSEDISGINYEIYESDGSGSFTSAGTTDNSDASVTLASGTSAYVIMTIDTPESGNSAVSGTLTVSANAPPATTTST